MSEKNDVGDAEAYQEELSEQVEDGGGCAETWAALAENRENNISRRSVLRGVGGTAGVALANTVGILSPVEASEGKSQETLEIVEASKGFQAIRGQIQSILEKDDAVSNKNKGDYFTSRKVQKPDAEEVSFLISSHTGSFQNEELDVDISVEISAMVDEKKR
ncbi:hypothetical protein [Haloarcula rubripromontorii]|uniref:hypothetical protein n=1 Tax=Haloarcula rubripromontorii TaxID=1705562 RepID=UPI0012BA870E|nr:hypothetical protein [Haloarcula rubripromontorii]